MKALTRLTSFLLVFLGVGIIVRTVDAGGGAAASASRIGAVIASACGTVTKARMWMPRRLRAASLAAVATTCSS